MSYEVGSQAPPPERSRTLRRAGVIAAFAVGLVAGGFGIASAATTPSPSQSTTTSPNQTTPTQPNGACPHAGGQGGAGEQRYDHGEPDRRKRPLLIGGIWLPDGNRTVRTIPGTGCQSRLRRSR